MRKRLFVVMTVGALMLSSVAWADNEATYIAGTGVLNIPKIDVGGVYYNVNLQQQGQNLVFAVTGVSQSSFSSQENVATYSAGIVHIPEVIVGGASYTVDMAQGEGLNFSVTGATQIVSATTDPSIDANFQGGWLGNWNDNFGLHGEITGQLQQSGSNLTGSVDVRTYTACPNATGVSISGEVTGNVAHFYGSYNCLGHLATVDFAQGILTPSGTMEGIFSILVDNIPFSSGAFSLTRQ